MLGEPISMLVPQVVGFKLSGRLPAGSTGTDLVLTVTEQLRALGVVGKFVEFFGHGLAGLPLADRATIANMAPECGSTCNFFPVDDETLRYLELTARPAERIALVEAYAQGAGPLPRPRRRADVHAGRRARPRRRRAESRRSPPAAGPRAADPGAAPPSRPRSTASAIGSRTRTTRRSPRRFRRATRPRTSRPGHEPAELTAPVARGAAPPASVTRRRSTARRFQLEHGSVVIAAITSCTNTSNPAVMVGAGLLAQARRRAGPDPPAVGEVEPRAGLEGRHRVPRPRRA